MSRQRYTPEQSEGVLHEAALAQGLTAAIVCHTLGNGRADLLAPALGLSLFKGRAGQEVAVHGTVEGSTPKGRS